MKTPEFLRIFVEPLDFNPVIYIVYCTYTFVNITIKMYATAECP